MLLLLLLFVELILLNDGDIFQLAFSTCLVQFEMSKEIKAMHLRQMISISLCLQAEAASTIYSHHFHLIGLVYLLVANVASMSTVISNQLASEFKLQLPVSLLSSLASQKW